MLDFNFQVPTRVLFGKNKIEKLGKEIRKSAQRILLVYGGGSIKRSGLYDTVINILHDEKIDFYELPGVQPNPRIASVHSGVELCRKNNLEMILAVGGGSTIDCAKIIAAGVYYEGDPWDFFLRKAVINKALPVGTILTIAATGSEMNGNAVISNEATQEKLGTGSPLLYPAFSILDPQYTFSVSAFQTAAGTADIMSHVFEQYFSVNQEAYLQDRLAEAVLKTCIKFAPIALREPENYTARANLMWAGSIALNGLLGTGKITDWATHGIEHEISAIYDVTHGLGLAILIPHWMKYVLDKDTLTKFCTYARNVWNLEGEDSFELAHQGIEKTTLFFKDMGLTGSLKEIGVKESDLEIMATKATARGSLGNYRKLYKQDVWQILKKAF